MGILIRILTKKRVTAPELARVFEVSRRTINRDIESFCLAGIPLVTRQGKGGGISLPEGFTLDEAFLTPSEIGRLSEGLNVLKRFYPEEERSSPLTRLAVANEGSGALSIDLQSFYGSSLIPKIHLIREGIGVKRDVLFTYYGEESVTRKRIRPVQIQYRWGAWYVRGYCREREGYRLYKLNRLWNPELGGRSAPAPSLRPGRDYISKGDLPITDFCAAGSWVSATGWKS